MSILNYLEIRDLVIKNLRMYESCGQATTWLISVFRVCHWKLEKRLFLHFKSYFGRWNLGNEEMEDLPINDKVPSRPWANRALRVLVGWFEANSLMGGFLSYLRSSRTDVFLCIAEGAGRILHCWSQVEFVDWGLRKRTRLQWESAMCAGR